MNFYISLRLLVIRAVKNGNISLDLMGDIIIVILFAFFIPSLTMIVPKYLYLIFFSLVHVNC